MVESEGLNLFAYGTLMFPAVWERIVGSELTSEPARVAGYVVRRVADDVYPVLIQGTDRDHAPGLVVRDIDDATFATLDRYESDLYERTVVQACLASGELLECQAYVLPARNKRHASDEPWTKDEFAARWLNDYLRRLR